MGATKTTIFTERHNRLAEVAKALGHPARIAIIEYLLRQKQCICKDIVNEIPLAQPTISQHLRVLKNAGLLQGSIEGTSVCYCVDPANMAELLRFGQQIMMETNCCDPTNDECC